MTNLSEGEGTRGYVFYIINGKKGMQILLFSCIHVTSFISWSQKNPEGRSELIEILKKAGREEGLVGLKPIALLKGESTL